MKIFRNSLLYIVFILLNATYSTPVEASEKFPSTYVVEGIVRDASNKHPLPGISVSQPGVGSVMTGDNGEFSIKISFKDVILTVSGPGYSTKYVSLRGRDTLEVFLSADNLGDTDEPILTPKEGTSPLQLTNAWSAIRGGRLLSTATTTDALLQGQAAGVNVIYRSGAPGNGANYFIRGLNSMNTSSEPLYVVDGLPYENSSYSNSLLGNYYSNPLASIDAKDVESITVMKDGTSLYGVKGANGVILIQTIKAKSLETKINFHFHTGINFAPKRIPLLGAAQHKLLISELLQSKGLSPSDIEALPYVNSVVPVKEKWGYDGNSDYYRYNHNTDWQDQLYTPSINQNYYLNISGGDDVALYALSVGYMEQGGTIKNTDFQRFNTRFNSEINLSKSFKLEANMSFVYSNRNLMDEGPYKGLNPVFSSLTKAPFMAVSKYNEEGKKSPTIEDFDVFGNSNPYALLNNSERTNNQYRFAGTIRGGLKLNKHFELNASLGVNFVKERERIFYPILGVTFDTLTIAVVRNEMQHRTDRLFSFYSEGYALYRSNLGAYSKLNAQVGIRYQNNRGEDDYEKAYNSGSNYFKSVGYGDALLNKVGGSISNWNWLSFYTNIDYSFRDKYFLSYVTSVDASSRYGRDAADYIVYPSLSAAWLLSGESFLKNFRSIDLLKLRTSYGVAGNDNIGNYNGLQYYVPQNLLGTYGLVRGNLVDLKLKPEKSQQLNLGIDLALFNERINLSLDWYRKSIRDLVTQSPISSLTGFDKYITNGGAMRNTGIDVAVDSRILNGNLKWSLGVRLSTYKNKVTSLNGQSYVTEFTGGEILTKVGLPVGVFYGYKTNGVYSTQQEAQADGLSIVNGSKSTYLAAGDVRFVNVNNQDKLINDNDKGVIGDPNPDFFGSISNTFQYKAWDLSLWMTYSVGNDVYNYGRSQLENLSGFDNQTQAVLNRWIREGDVTSIPRATYGDPVGNSRFSDRWIEDGSYLKLKTVTLSYHLIQKQGFLRSCTFFLTGENLFTFTRYKGLDPEFSYGRNILNSGVDVFAISQPRTFSIGFKLDL